MLSYVVPDFASFGEAPCRCIGLKTTLRACVNQGVDVNARMPNYQATARDDFGRK